MIFIALCAAGVLGFCGGVGTMLLVGYLVHRQREQTIDRIVEDYIRTEERLDLHESPTATHS